MYRKPINVPLTESKKQELHDEIDAARKSLEIPKTADGSHCAIWSAARAVILENYRVLNMGYEMIIIEVEDE